MFAAERLAPLPPTVFLVVVTEERTATRQALIDWRGNRYSVPPQLAAAKVIVHQRLGASTIDIATVSGVVLARHQVAEAGLGGTIRDGGHVTALEAIALASAPPGRPHRKRERIPPGTDARRAATELTGTPRTHDRDQPGRLRAGREEQEHPPMNTSISTTTTTATPPP